MNFVAKHDIFKSHADYDAASGFLLVFFKVSDVVTKFTRHHAVMPHGLYSANYRRTED